jgi:hypothetical protein
MRPPWRWSDAPASTELVEQLPALSPPTGLCRCRRRLDQPDERHHGPDDDTESGTPPATSKCVRKAITAVEMVAAK